MHYNQLKTLIRRVTLAMSLFGSHLFEDPNDLLLKVGQKLRTKGVPFRVMRFPSPNEDGELLFQVGELSRSIKKFELSGVRGAARARKVHRQLEEFNMPILQSDPPEKRSGHKNVLFYLTNSKPFTQSGYTERSHFIMKALKELGVNVRAVTRLGYPVVIGNFPLQSSIVIDGVEYRQLLPSNFPRKKDDQTDLAVNMLVNEAQSFNAQVLHTTTDYKNAIIVSRAAKILGIPWVYETRGELHKTWLSKRNADIRIQAAQSEYFIAARNKELEAMKKSGALIHLSDVSKQDSVRCGIPEERIEIVPNAVSEAEFERTFNKIKVRDELGLRRNKKLIGTITSIVQYEGLDDLIRAVEMLPDVHCVIVGDGEAKPELELLVKSLGLEERIQFAGKQPADSIWKWYAALDIFVIPRKDQEVCRTVTPIKTLMAQVSRVPVVSSDLPALREVTGNHATYFSAEQPHDLANALIAVLNSEHQAIEDQVQEARRWVKTRTWTSNAMKLMKVYGFEENM